MSARARFWAIVALMLGALTLCVYVAVERIEGDLLTRAQTALAAAGVPFYGVSVEGRDVILQGFVPSEEEAVRVRTVVAGLDGVRRVRDAMTVERVTEPRPSGPGTAPAPVLAPARLRVQRLGRRLFVSGSLPADGSAEALLRAARERFGNGNVTSSLRVREDVDHPPWLDAPDRLVEILAGASDNVRLLVEGTTGILAGQVPRARDVDRLRDLAASVPGLDWRIELFTPRSPSAGGGP